MRTFDISSAKQGVTRLRNKGGPAKDSFYTLKNCYVTSDNSVMPRPGTRLAYSLPAGTKGLCAFRGQLHVFSSTSGKSLDPMIVVNILRHPSPGSKLELARIHFAAPFLGFLYVVAEFESGEVFHYWVQSATTWQAGTSYLPGAIVVPTVPNGYYYRARRSGEPGVAWAPGVARTIGDKVEPTTTNGFEYTVIETYGATPRSGSMEPVWPAIPGGTVAEDTEGGVPAPPTTPTTPGNTVPPDVGDRYGTGVNANRNITRAL